MAKRNITIPKGKIVHCIVKSEMMQDERIFTNGGKLNKWLRFLDKNNPVGLKIEFKEFRRN